MSTIYKNGTYYGQAGDPMPSTDMEEVLSPLPSVMSRRMKYSTDEQIVGTWIDGKPIYQKVLTGLYWTTSRWTTTSLNSFLACNPEQVILAEFLTGSRCGCFVMLSLSEGLYAQATNAVGDGICIFQYTKTTD